MLAFVLQVTAYYLNNTVVGNYNNTMKTTFELNFDLNYAVKQHGYTKTWELTEVIN